MATTEERLNKMTIAVREVLVELLDPSASRTRVERSILPDLYTTMDEENRKEIGRQVLGSCFNDTERKETKERLDELESMYFRASPLTF